ncbi:pyridoxamine 5'-phosphate oxidase [Streptomyces sp. SID2999]|uniref:pyridoxamine 5'-phosphate oxidase family protein n=1 Tax=Streptomyces sp. SID2999 TaxID=2690258 RepID=UPI00136A17D0|nr:pyridoxamine 5'-phosphate oxidase family protein [Streptomyces sp. SID2999]MYZ10938.1 pyridoxamine 5'-phosphate oxidase [Streptomyces sp. SID2999]
MHTPRDPALRIRDTLTRLTTERDLWLATSHPTHGPHQVPLWFAWDGEALWMCTSATSATARNLREDPRARLSLPDTTDVVLLQGTAQLHPAADAPPEAEAFTTEFTWDPRTEESPYVYLRVEPKTIRAWRGVAELRGRVVMRDGVWAR